MATIKCRMCGEAIEMGEGRYSGTCIHCAGTVTFPAARDAIRLDMFDRANALRLRGEFDTALALYQQILDMDGGDAEAHWGAALSRYGVVYVEDAVTHRRVPACRIAQPVPFTEDEDCRAALEHAPDGLCRSIYAYESGQITKVQKDAACIRTGDAGDPTLPPTQSAPEAAKKRGVLRDIAGVALILVMAAAIFFGVTYFRNKRSEETYQRAVAALSVGKTEEALDLFSSLGDYRDSEVQSMLIMRQRAKDILGK